MLENTGNVGTKVPNSFAIVAVNAVVAQAREFHDQARETAERERAEERARAFDRLNASRKDAVQVAADAPSSDAPSSSSAPDTGAVSEPTRGTAVDLNA